MRSSDTAYERKASDFAGTWIRKVDGRIFMVLRLNADGGEFKGTLSRPRHFSEVSGGQITVTDPHVIDVTVLDGTMVTGNLRFSTQSPSDPKNETFHQNI
jgi:hypothetical protein